MTNEVYYPCLVGNWYLGERLGAGFSGSIFKAQSVYNNQVMALKIQPIDTPCPTNKYERSIYPALQGGKGMPTLWAYGEEGPWDYLVIDLLGPSLDNLIRKSGKTCMDLGSVCHIAMQVISRLAFMHSRGVLHRDIQLGNCVIGLPPNHETIYMIDFGFSKRYIDPMTRRHIPDSKAKRDFIGNYWFSSVNVHCRGKVPSRRDDLEACALMLIHLMTPGGLSWTRNGVPKSDAAHDRIIYEKKHARPEDLCRGLPAEFEEFLRYCRRLQFAECPDYKRWAEEFKALALEYGYHGTERFIWPPPLVEPKPLPSSQVPPAHNVEKILKDLAGLKLDNRPVLGDRKNIGSPVRQEPAQQDPKKSTPPAAIVISSNSDNHCQANRQSKTAQLAFLTIAVTKASNNAALSDLVADFVTVFKSHSSRALTKQGFAFLDALYKQLADPSVFIVPLRTPRTRSVDKGQENPEPEPRHVRMNKLWLLRRDVANAATNRVLGRLVADFGALTNKSSARTVTKDGLAFLEDLALQLKTLQ